MSFPESKKRLEEQIRQSNDKHPITQAVLSVLEHNTLCLHPASS
jgi:hypothetical protein